VAAPIFYPDAIRLLADAQPSEPAFGPPTLSGLFVPVTGYSKLIPGRKPAMKPEVAPLEARLRIAAKRAWINYRHDRQCGYEMSQAILRDSGAKREFTHPRWVSQQMRRGQALERLVADDYVVPGMVLWFSNAPGTDPNRLDTRANHSFYTCVGTDERGLPEFAGVEGDRVPFATVAAKLRLSGCALDTAFPLTPLA
jgi:hypothetical protein